MYSWACAAGHAIRMASRLNGRSEVLIPRLIDPERLSVIRNYCEPVEMAGHLDVTLVDYDPATGRIELDDLREKLSDDTTAVYIDNPTFLGVIEADVRRDRRSSHDAGAEPVVGIDPISLGVLATARRLWRRPRGRARCSRSGVHMNCGGGSADSSRRATRSATPANTRPC